jgi:DNA polymerase beta
MSSPSIDYTPQIIHTFEILEQEERAKRDHFRAKAYKEAIIAIRGHGTPIYRPEDVIGIRGIGKSMREKIDQIIANHGHLARAQAASEDPALIFAQIHGIGPVKAAELVSSGITTID